MQDEEDLYAPQGDRIVQTHDVSEFVDDACVPVKNSAGKSLTWVKMYPNDVRGKRKLGDSERLQTHSGLLLIDTKRCGTNYPNRFDPDTNVAVFYLDRNPNVVNDMLRDEAAQDDPALKRAVRLVEYVSMGSTIMVDCGDFHVTSVGNDDRGRPQVRMRRLAKWTPLPSGRRYKHASERTAHEFLEREFRAPQHLVRYEPLTLNLVDCQLRKGDPTAGIAAYNVDFTLRDAKFPFLVGVEVKKDAAAWKAREDEAAMKIEGWRRVMGSECVVLLMEPSPRFFRLGKSRPSDGFLSTHSYDLESLAVDDVKSLLTSCEVALCGSMSAD